MPKNRKGTVRKPLSEMSGHQRKFMAQIVSIAESEGFDGCGADVLFTGSGHPQLVLTDTDGRELRLRVSNTPRNEGNELKHAKRRIRAAIQQWENP